LSTKSGLVIFSIYSSSAICLCGFPNGAAERFLTANPGITAINPENSTQRKPESFDPLRLLSVFIYDTVFCRRAF